MYPPLRVACALLAQTFLVAGAPSEAKQDVSHLRALAPPVFRPGSGAYGLQPSSHARATALPGLPEPTAVTAGPLSTLPDPTAEKAVGQISTAAPTPLLTLQSVTTISVVALVVATLSGILCMGHRRGRGGHHHTGGHPPLGFGHVPPVMWVKSRLTGIQIININTASGNT